jgi:hypothetical protein
MPPLPSPPPPTPPPLTCDSLLSRGTNLRNTDRWCDSLKTEEACGTLNYVPVSGAFKQCGFKKGQCLAAYGDLVCAFPAAPSPPPFPPKLTCDTLLATGTNLQAGGRWCNNLVTEEECGSLNYVPLSGMFRQCGFSNGECLARHGDLVCPFPAAPSPPPFPPPGLTCETLLATGTNLRRENKFCDSLKTEEECGTFNYVPQSGVFRQCGFRNRECLARYGDLTCPIPPSS